MRNLRNALRRLERQQEESAARGDERHHQIDEQLAGIVAMNSARLDALEAALAVHNADKKAHK